MQKIQNTNFTIFNINYMESCYEARLMQINTSGTPRIRVIRPETRLTVYRAPLVHKLRFTLFARSTSFFRRKPG